MTSAQFKYIIDVQKEFEFTYNGRTYNMTYGSDARGAYIAFGRLYDVPARYRSAAELLNAAKLDGRFLQEILPEL